ncbi:hypothetical protein IKS57_01945 [bacterium]|nr:hypothetical protein [bacterium]
MREVIQAMLEEIQDIEVTTELPDEVLEESKTYFSFTLQNDYQNEDIDQNYTYRPYILGYVKRVENLEENTLEIVDRATEDIVNKLKELNIRASYRDVTLDKIRKIQVTGYSLYNEINNKLI